jgi:hypothetical protein
MLPMNRLGEIALRELKIQAADSLMEEPLTPEVAERAVQEIIDGSHTWITRGVMNWEEALDFALYLMPDEDSRLMLCQAITKITGIAVK